MPGAYRAFTVHINQYGELQLVRGIRTSWNKDLDSRVVALGGSKGVQVLVTGSKPGKGKKNQVLRTVSLVGLSRKVRSLVGETGLEDHPDNGHAELESGVIVLVDFRRPKGVPSVGASSLHVGLRDENVGELPTIIAFATVHRNAKTGDYLGTDALIKVSPSGRIVIHPNGWSGRLYDLTVEDATPILRESREAWPEDTFKSTAELRQIRRAIDRAEDHLDILKSSVLDTSTDMIRRMTLNHETKRVMREIAELKKDLLGHQKMVDRHARRARNMKKRRDRRRAE